MYETPKGRAVRRGAVTREEIEAEQAEAELLDWLLDVIESEPKVREAIVRIAAGAPKPRQPRPTTTTQQIRRGRSR